MRKGFISLILLIFSIGVMAQSNNKSGKDYVVVPTNYSQTVEITKANEHARGTQQMGVLGDLNGDGDISVSDVMRLVDMILGLYEDKNIINVIVNTGDDSITYGGGGTTPAHAGQYNIWEE